MHSFEYQTKKIEYRMVKSNRKSISITILPTKEVVVKAPKILSDYEIMNMVKKKGKWIFDKLSTMEEVTTSSDQRFKEGSGIFYRGEEYHLRIIVDHKVKKTEITIHQNEIIITMNQNNPQLIPSILENWYKERVKELINNKIEFYNSIINRKIANIRIKNHKKRWGSCSNLGNLNFNWRIIMMPDEMSDYIIVHELCHLIHLNHSKEYWKSVENILPDYKEREKWIKQNGLKYLI